MKVDGYIPLPPQIAKLTGMPSGFNTGTHVEVMKGDIFFSGWRGHILSVTEDDSLAIDLDEPPPGHQRNR